MDTVSKIDETANNRAAISLPGCGDGFGGTYKMTEQRSSGPTRRSVLTSVGAVGVGGYGFLRFRKSSTTSDEVRYTNYTLAETHGPQILVGWYSTYNGELRSGAPTDDSEWRYDSTDGYIDDVGSIPVDHPAVDLSNVLPGDSGTLSVGLFVDPDSESGRLWARLESGGGSLAEATHVQMWYDTGNFGIGGCQGAENGTPIDTITSENATLADPGAIAEGVELNPGIFDNGQIDPGDQLCIALAWTVPASVDNKFQGASTGFDLEFAAVSADDPANPFEGGD